eukprot:TRINITY_DN73_c0_g1_i1.p2 TRINITY_DN73_c0_g1~~TRINITY_DN73_c0_g1_i1.p2  ORF type:complete len:174 (+),score=72.34 TRINITY_DN73_c0_g1_i1:209-730(+)
MDPMVQVLNEDGILSIMDFDFVPYGNARNVSGTIECQHGARECTANMAEACVKNLTSNAPLQYMPFMQCVEKIGSFETLKEMEKCADTLGLDWSSIDACMNNGLGDQLINIEGHKTAAANISYTPYIACNGKALDSSDMITSTVCNLWTGSKPACCSQAKAVGGANITRSYRN